MNAMVASLAAFVLLCVPFLAVGQNIGGEPLAVREIDGEVITVLSMEKKRVWRDQFGEESRAKDGEQWVVFQMQFASPRDTIEHSPLELVDANGRSIASTRPDKIHWMSMPAPGNLPPPEKKIIVPMENTVVFSVPEGTELKTLRVGSLTFDIAEWAAPKKAAAPAGAVIRGKVLRGSQFDAKPQADTPVALVAYPQAKEQAAGKEKGKGEKKKEGEFLFLSIAQETRCDEEGAFAFTGVAPGTYLLSVQATFGMATGMHNVTVGGENAVIEIAAESDVVELTVMVDANGARRMDR